jgi:hypothetical protein
MASKEIAAVAPGGTSGKSKTELGLPNINDSASNPAVTSQSVGLRFVIEYPQPTTVPAEPVTLPEFGVATKVKESATQGNAVAMNEIRAAPASVLT